MSEEGWKMSCCIPLCVIKLCTALSFIYHYQWEYFGKKDISRDSHVSSGSMENVPTVEMWTLIPTPKTTSISSAELFCRSMCMCPVSVGCSHWHCFELNCTIEFSVTFHWLFAHITWLFLSSSISPKFSELLILQNFWLMFHILWKIRIPL